MKSILINTKSKKELDFVSELLTKLKISSRTLNFEDIEDIGMGELMKEADRTKTISRDVIMKKLTK
ncbi:MAG: hypothetical protein KA713_11525 [Chryseotalea sp. WA131a]|jgi:hypothetical protein|nr:MAG: hypothetical protein KA713_11525 [Chryseotalea sp. WA131a]